MEAGPQPADQFCSLRGKDFLRFLAAQIGKLLLLATIYNFLHRLNYSYRCPRPRHDQADPIKQQAFLTSLPAQLQEIAAAYPGKRLRAYFQDEARMGQQVTMTRMGAKTGSRPTAVRQTAYKYVWVIAAVCPVTSQSTGLIAPRLNMGYINTFLEKLSKDLAMDEYSLMLWDGAGFHRGKALFIRPNITPIQLTAYSPELNPIENPSHYLKCHHSFNHAYRDADELEEVVIHFWQTSVMNNELIKSFCSVKIYQHAASR